MASTASAITDTSPTEVALTISPAAGASSANARSTRSRPQQIGIAAATIHHLEIVFLFPVPNAAALFAASLRSRQSGAQCTPLLRHVMSIDPACDRPGDSDTAHSEPVTALASRFTSSTSVCEPHADSHYYEDIAKN